MHVLVCEHYSAKLKSFSLSGTVFMPPKWSLGYHQCHSSYLSDQRVLEVLGSLSIVTILVLVAFMYVQS